MGAIVLMQLTILFFVDRLLKFGLVTHFFGRPGPPEPVDWPKVALIQPVTRGATRLAANLAARTQLRYPGSIHHLVACDAADASSQAIVRAWIAAWPQAQISLLQVELDGGQIASKTVKMAAALAQINEPILCFIDDDIAPRPDALRQLISHLQQPGVGAVFGLACAVSWETPWSSLMSLFVNNNALVSYIPLTYFSEPYTITGHLYAVARTDFEAAGGLHNMRSNIGDDHALARQLRALGLRLVQTPVIYDVANAFASPSAYTAQLKRWFVFPRQAMLPYLTCREKAASALLSLGMFLPSLGVLIALLRPSWSAARSLLGMLLAQFGLYVWQERCYLHRSTPSRGWLLLPVVLFLTPWQILWYLLRGDDSVIWRGRRLRIGRGGEFEVLS